MKNYYQILGIAPDSDFAAVKKAYYRRAKECHPDRHANDKAREEEFKLVVEAFDILSDPLKRSRFDRQNAASASGGDASIVAAGAPPPESIMDTSADDDLEELITGNAMPLNSTLSTLFLDLTRTEVFVNFREGKNYFYQKRYRAARNCFIQVVAHSPGNIVYRAYLARVCAMLGDYTHARQEYRRAIDLGRLRSPPQELRRLRRELDDILKKHSPWWLRLLGLFTQQHHELSEDAAADMIEETNRTIARLTASRQRKEEHKETKLLNK